MSERFQQGERVVYVGRNSLLKGRLATIVWCRGGFCKVRWECDRTLEDSFTDLCFAPVSAVDLLARVVRFEPTNADIGRAVVYTPAHGPAEDGVLTSFNDSYVFVRFRSQHPAAGGQACRRQDLRWLA